MPSLQYDRHSVHCVLGSVSNSSKSPYVAHILNHLLCHRTERVVGFVLLQISLKILSVRVVLDLLDKFTNTIVLSLFHNRMWKSGSWACVSYVHFCTRPCSSTCRWSRLATHRHREPHSMCSPCPHAHFGFATSACVSSLKRLGCLHFLGASTFRRSDPFVRIPFTSQNHDPKNWRQINTEAQLSSASVPTRVFRHAGCHMYRIIAGIIVDIAKIEDLSGSVQISTRQGLDLPDKQAEMGDPRVWRKNRRACVGKRVYLVLSRSSM